MKPPKRGTEGLVMAMAEYFNRASLMGKLTSSEMQMAMREMSGIEAYSAFLALLNSEPAVYSVDDGEKEAVTQITTVCKQPTIH